ncbi:hypothetical protein [Brotaphodocola sp.]|uniref:hypothetical protein n=1 Tax=Brotaphodocola sp. TaxID=3073577 RepID=UPI003D7D9EB5
MDSKWKELYDAAKQVLKPRDVSKIIEAGGVSSLSLNTYFPSKFFRRLDFLW